MQSDVDNPVSELQSSETEIRQKQTRNSGPHKGWGITLLKNGKLWLRIRNKDGQYSEVFPKDTPKGKIRDIAIKKLQELKDSVHGLPTKEFNKITFQMLADAALKHPTFKDMTPNNKIMINAFLRNEKALCAMSLTKITWRDIQRHVNRRIEAQDVKPYTITRMLVPVVAVYREATRTDLYGLVPNFAGIVPNPFNANELQLPADTSGRKRFLEVEDDIKIYMAINKHCRTFLMKRRMITLVRLAITTALRRNVLLQLRWKDVRFNDKVISIPPDYYPKKKPAPEMVPLSTRMFESLRDFYKDVPETERKPGCKLFPNQRERESMNGKTRNDKDYSPNTTLTRWCDDAWNRVIRLTDLWVPFLDDKGQQIIGEDGEPIKDWFHFHDLRHTAVTRYRNKPYSLDAKYYDYLLGKEKHRYAHLNLVEFCDEMRKDINKGDAIIEKQLANQLIIVKADWGHVEYRGKYTSEEVGNHIAMSLIKDNEEK